MALILGEDATRASARIHLGYFPERATYPRHLTGAELLDREGRFYGFTRPERRERAGRLLERVQVSPKVYTRRIGTYSKGERARIGLALALVGDPAVVLLDEPTDGLDPLGRKAVRDLLRGLRDENRAVLLNSHLLSEVEACCDRVVILKAGTVIAQGSPADLLATRRVVYVIRLAVPPTPELVRALGQECESASLLKDDQIKVTLADEAGIDRVVDFLRRQVTSIRELRPTASLEDVFLDLVGDGSASSDGEDG